VSSSCAYLGVVGGACAIAVHRRRVDGGRIRAWRRNQVVGSRRSWGIHQYAIHVFTCNARLAAPVGEDLVEVGRRAGRVCVGAEGRVEPRTRGRRHQHRHASRLPCLRQRRAVLGSVLGALSAMPVPGALSNNALPARLKRRPACGVRRG
jgi:hypothetical protein